MEYWILGYLAALLMGVTLGMLGAGGSILTVPILYYLFGIDTALSTAYSLFVVGITALAGTIPNVKRKLINYKVAAYFAAPSMVAVWLTRAYLLPAIPDNIQVGRTPITQDHLLLMLFAVIMLLAAFSMLRRQPKHDQGQPNRPGILIVLDGFIIGTITGLVGAGGGFLIIPALVVLGKLEMPMAVGTSLLIIAIKSLVGFTGDVFSGQLMDYRFLAQISLVTIAGILIGTKWRNFVDARKLKTAFAWFLVVMGFWIIISEWMHIE